ncbi:hypothetical protein QBC34DRAFT_392634 [Podospora aff. communis PSN243]|uniref:Fibronectin type-III domain-containing protein n=1 Tax=Podospora aff. communis PSN243 TaxID=3040156 RepID=A0AAV9H1Y0_9PEZI|nr:hypothetical protein QBC34DRAFT_392634 [Podospora aff. communis PSN243]
MSWISWTTSLVPTLLVVLASLAWWHTEPKTAVVNLIAFGGVVFFCFTVAPGLTRDLSLSAYTSYANTVAALSLDSFVVRHANMLLTGAAVVWLVRRAWQTLWKPVPELISILGVDVPDPPDVSLAGIRADAATLNWTRAPANRSAQKFLIQVNGVVVGDVAANQEPAIVVSGLKPDHFYNVRVIAVGSNNFQAGSRVIRLRTFGQDGRPQLGNSRLPANFMTDEPRGAAQGEYLDENGAPRTLFPALETATSPETLSAATRDGNFATGGGPRRNTVTRRHSPSTTSLDQAPIRDEINANSKKTLPELTEKFESIRKETEDVISLIGKEEAENRRLLDELEAERLEKKGEQKKKEEQTERLKRDVHSTDRSMRNALQRKAQKEKLLKERQNELTKYHDNIEKWERQMEEMRRNKANFDEQMRELEGARDKKAEVFREGNGDLQAECSRLEQELKEKREQVKELEEARKTLLGGEEDGEWREKEAELRREGIQRSRELQELLNYETKHARKLEEQIRVLSLQVQAIPSTQVFGPYNQPNSSVPEFDNPTVTQLKRRSRNSNSLSSISISSPLPPYSQIDPAGPGFGSSRIAALPPGFAQAPYMDLSADLPSRLDEAGLRASLAPLSPSATALLPSNILDDFDDDDPSPMPSYGPEPFMPHHNGTPDNDPQSPASSGRAMSILGSPHGSTHNLPFSSYQPDIDRRGLHTASTMPANPGGDAAPNKLMEFFSFQRARTAKGIEGEGPLLGSLKSGQSQSFPRQTDEADVLGGKRRISLSGTWNMFNRNSAGPEVMEPHAPPSSRMFSARNLNPFSSSHRAPGGLLAERDPSSPRPASIASSDFPRPSTDSGIWGPPGGEKPRNLWSPDNIPWSRNPSRRPSLHGSPSALKTTLASADDEILDDDDAGPNVKEVGVIGSRPPQNSKAALGRLNPNAPAFIGSLFKPKSEKDGKEGKKPKDGHKPKDKTKEPKDKSKGKEPALTPDTTQPLTDLDSPTDSRKSRDGYSVHTQTSLSESRDSLTLDQPFSNMPSEPTSGGLAGSIKDDNVVRKLFRKSSSGKFSLPGRLGSKESGLFKKGPSSVASGANSDRGFSMERSSIGDFEEIAADEASGINLVARSYDSVTSSPGLGPATGSVKSKDGGNKTSVRWLSNFGKKGKKEKESLDLDRAQVSESEGTVDEGGRL